MDAQIAALRARFAEESSELETIIAEARLVEDTIAEQHKVLSSLRKGQAFRGSPNGRRGAADGSRYQAGRINARKKRARVQTK
jgi:hypothetical protein